jgi:hypothetical protein
MSFYATPDLPRLVAVVGRDVHVPKNARELCKSGSWVVPSFVGLL